LVNTLNLSLFRRSRQNS